MFRGLTPRITPVLNPTRLSGTHPDSITVKAWHVQACARKNGKFNLHALGFAKPAWLLNSMDPKEMPSEIIRSNHRVAERCEVEAPIPLSSRQAFDSLLSHMDILCLHLQKWYASESSDDDDSRNAVQISIIDRLIESSGGLGQCGHIRFACLAGSHGNFAARSHEVLSTYPEMAQLLHEVGVAGGLPNGCAISGCGTYLSGIGIYHWS